MTLILSIWGIMIYGDRFLLFLLRKTKNASNDSVFMIRGFQHRLSRAYIEVQPISSTAGLARDTKNPAYKHNVNVNVEINIMLLNNSSVV